MDELRDKLVTIAAVLRRDGNFITLYLSRALFFLEVVDVEKKEANWDATLPRCYRE